jgi:transposase
VLDSELRQLEAIERELEKVDEQLATIAQHEPRVRLLMTLPGVNYVVALALLSALGDLSRFQDGDQAAAVFGWRCRRGILVVHRLWHTPVS